jgi:TRAP-type C4-dicarboxylate transport system permease small subunit
MRRFSRATTRRCIMDEQASIERRSGVESAVRAFFNQLTRAECMFAVACLCLSAGALVADIFSREVLGFGLWGSLRVAVYTTALAALSGFAICVATGSHLRISALDSVTPERWRPLVSRVGHVVSFAICMFFAYWSLFYVQQTYRIGETDPSLGIVVWPIQCILIWMFMSGGLRYLAYAIFPALEPGEAEPVQ